MSVLDRRGLVERLVEMQNQHDPVRMSDVFDSAYVVFVYMPDAFGKLECVGMGRGQNNVIQHWHSEFEKWPDFCVEILTYHETQGRAMSLHCWEYEEGVQVHVMFHLWFRERDGCPQISRSNVIILDPLPGGFDWDA